MTDITAANQSTVKSYKYDAFGNILQETGPTVPGGITYTGRQYHSRSGLYYYRARWYSPQLGRFLTQDPIGYLGGTNLYAYVGNAPVDLIDPLGLQGGPMFDPWGGFTREYGKMPPPPEGYLDANATVGSGGAVTFGAMFDKNGLHPYIGPAIASGPGLALTYAPMDTVSKGLNVGFQMGFVEGGQVGRGGGEWFWELGFMTPGFTLSWYYVFDPLLPNTENACPTNQ